MDSVVQESKSLPIQTVEGDIVGELTIVDHEFDDLNTVISPILTKDFGIIGWLISPRTDLDTNEYNSIDELREKQSQ